MALALGKNGNQHIRTRHFFAAGRLHMDNGALDNPLEASRGLGLQHFIRNQVGQFRVDVSHKIGAQLIHIHIAGAHDGHRILVFNQRQKQMFERRELVVALIGVSQSAMEGLLKAA